MSDEKLGRQRLEDLVHRKYPNDANNRLLIDSVSGGGEDFGAIAELSEAALEELVEMEKRLLEG
jgi:hypothetical protein